MNKPVKRVEITLKKTLDNVESVGRLNGSETTATFARQFYHEDIELYESFFLIMCNNAMTPIAWAKISQGGVVGTTVDPILVAKYACDSLARNVILVHNHPSGNLRPSEEDKRLTKRIADGLGLFAIRVADHVILSSDDYYSFYDNGLL